MSMAVRMLVNGKRRRLLREAAASCRRVGSTHAETASSLFHATAGRARRAWVGRPHLLRPFSTKTSGSAMVRGLVVSERRSDGCRRNTSESAPRAIAARRRSGACAFAETDRFVKYSQPPRKRTTHWRDRESGIAKAVQATGVDKNVAAIGRWAVSLTYRRGRHGLRVNVAKKGKAE